MLASQQDMRPTQRRYVREKLGRNVEPFVPPLCDGMAEMNGIPAEDDRGQEVEVGDPVVLSLSRAIADFTLATDTKGTLEGMVGLTLIEPDLGAPLHVRVENPLYNEECACDTADLAQRDREIIFGAGRKRACARVGWA